MLQAEPKPTRTSKALHILLPYPIKSELFICIIVPKTTAKGAPLADIETDVGQKLNFWIDASRPWVAMSSKCSLYVETSVFSVLNFYLHVVFRKKKKKEI